MHDDSRWFSILRAHALERLEITRYGAEPTVLAHGAAGPAQDLPSEFRGPALDHLVQAMRRAGASRLLLVSHEATGLSAVIAVQEATMGPAVGGLRRLDAIVPEHQVVIEALDLARTMAAQAAIATIGRGGAEVIVHGAPPPGSFRTAWSEALYRLLERADLYALPDTGFELADFEALSHFGPRLVGLKGGGSVTTTALGLKESLRAAAAALGKPLSECSIIVQGLGELGSRLARSLAAEGARLILTDKDHRRIDGLLASFEPDWRERTQVIAPYQVATTEADIWCPCAPRAAIDAAMVPELKVRTICGGARHQLLAHSPSEELALAELLQRRSILWIPDWIAAAGGMIHGAMEIAQGDRFDAAKAHARARRICGWVVDEILQQAKRTDRTPLEIARKLLPA